MKRFGVQKNKSPMLKLNPVPQVICPHCESLMTGSEVWFRGESARCVKCMGILVSRDWLKNNIHKNDYTRLSKRIFTGSPAGFNCPFCTVDIEMSKWTVAPRGYTFEVDGCLKCGSMWFDYGELEMYLEGEVGKFVSRTQGDFQKFKNEKFSNENKEFQMTYSILELIISLLS